MTTDFLPPWFDSTGRLKERRKGLRRLAVLTPLLMIYLLTTDVYAAQPSVNVGNKEQVSQPADESKRFWSRLYLGSFDGEENPGKLENESGGLTLGGGISVRLPKTKYLSSSASSFCS